MIRVFPYVRINTFGHRIDVQHEKTQGVAVPGQAA